MIDKELIKQEIERRLSNLWYLIPEGEKVLQDSFTKEDANNLGKYTALESILQFIDSIPEEPASEDLEEELNRWQIYHDYPEEYLDLLNFARHFAEWRKQEMMKDAVECTVHQCEVNGIKLDGVEILSNGLTLDEKVFKDGDKVKIIIVKEE